MSGSLLVISATNAATSELEGGEERERGREGRRKGGREGEREGGREGQRPEGHGGRENMDVGRGRKERSRREVISSSTSQANVGHQTHSGRRSSKSMDFDLVVPACSYSRMIPAAGQPLKPFLAHPAS